MTLFEELKWRGLINDMSHPELEEKLNNEKLTFYIGTDPTGDSLHIGHFSSFLIALFKMPSFSVSFSDPPALANDSLISVEDKPEERIASLNVE